MSAATSSASSAASSSAAPAALPQLPADHSALGGLLPPPPPPPPQPSEQLCYVHCHFCDTVLVVSVPSSSLYKTVAVRCGHCGSLLTVNMRGLLCGGGGGGGQLHFGHSLSLVPPPPSHHSLLDEMSCTNPSMLLEQQPSLSSLITSSPNCPAPGAGAAAVKGAQETAARRSAISNPAVNRPPEKRQRVPSAYNRFIKDEIQRIKAGNPDISHREAFSAAAKNWAHFPHIHFGLMPEQQNLKKTSFLPQDHHQHHHHQRKDGLLKDGLYAAAAAAAAAAANMGVSPY